MYNVYKLKLAVILSGFYVLLQKEDMDVWTKRQNTPLIIFLPSVSEHSTPKRKRKKATITDKKKRSGASARAVLTTFQELI